MLIISKYLSKVALRKFVLLFFLLFFIFNLMMFIVYIHIASFKCFSFYLCLRSLKINYNNSIHNVIRFGTLGTENYLRRCVVTQ